MTVRTSKPTHAVEVRSYSALSQYAEAFALGNLNLLILVGRAGTAKSQTMRRVVSDRVCWIESNATAYGMYQKLYHHRDQPVVIDDVDGLYNDRTAIRLLKCICQTDPIKNIAWHTGAAGDGTGIPREFQTQSQVCIIANEWKSLNANTAAVEDRGHLVIFDPPPEEVHQEVGKWFWDQVVYDWFADYLHLMPNLTMRSYIRAYEQRISGLPWVETLLGEEVSQKALLVAKLKGDPSFQTERDRVAEFTRLGGGNVTTWYKWSKRIRAPYEVEALKIPLSSKPPSQYKAA